MVVSLLVALVIIFSFRSWATLLPVSSGDWPYLFFENIKEFSWLPQIRFLWLAPYYQILTKFVVQYLGVPWVIGEKVFWFFPFIFLSLFSSYKLTKSPLGSLIYTTNTYALMIVGGGQMGVAMAYSLAPFVLHRFISFYRANIKYALVAGILLAVQVMFDPRIALLTLFASVFYYLIHNDLRRLTQALGVPLGIASLLNLYWIIPLVRSHTSIAQQLGEATIESAKFLSFATFEQTISLLHPNWPENIFGKVYFMRSEFLILPILAFSSLLFISKIKDQKSKIQIKNQKDKEILFFSSLLLLGAFLAKGTNPPFGEVYAWMFTRVPGFSLFRDPTKFYLFIALAFSVLIPSVIETVKKRKMASFLFIIFWVFTVRQAIVGQLTGTFRPMPVPQEYVKLKDFIYRQPQAFQTLWIPEKQRFGYSSNLHPSLDASVLSGESSISGILDWMNEEGSKRKLDASHIKYVVVPYDSRGELFLTDRKFDENLYSETVASVSAIPWLLRVSEFKSIAVFEKKL